MSTSRTYGVYLDRRERVLCLLRARKAPGLFPGGGRLQSRCWEERGGARGSEWGESVGLRPRRVEEGPLGRWRQECGR